MKYILTTLLTIFVLQLQAQTPTQQIDTVSNDTISELRKKQQI